jgi:nicotinic acid phosphoribosyltransferase
VVTGLGRPTAGFVYKMVSAGDEPGSPERPVAKHSPGKATVGGRKRAWRARLPTVPERFDGPAPRYDRPVWADVLSTSGDAPADEYRPLQHRVVDAGKVILTTALEEVRLYHADVRQQLGDGQPLISCWFSPSDPRA